MHYAMKNYPLTGKRGLILASDHPIVEVQAIQNGTLYPMFSWLICCFRCCPYPFRRPDCSWNQRYLVCFVDRVCSKPSSVCLSPNICALISSDTLNLLILWPHTQQLKAWDWEDTGKFWILEATFRWCWCWDAPWKEAAWCFWGFRSEGMLWYSIRRESMDMSDCQWFWQVGQKSASAKLFHPFHFIALCRFWS